MLLKNYFPIKTNLIKIGCHPKKLLPSSLNTGRATIYTLPYDNRKQLILIAKKIMDTPSFVVGLEEIKHPTKGYRKKRKSYQVVAGGEAYYIKLLHRSSPFQILADILRLSKLKQCHAGVYGELIHTVIAKEAGLPTTDIRVYAESKTTRLKPRRSALIISHIPKEALSITKLIKYRPDLFESIIDALIALIIQMWNSGVIHNDLHLGNIVFCQNRGLYLIDWETVHLVTSPSKNLLCYLFGYLLSKKSIQTSVGCKSIFMKKLRMSFNQIFGRESTNKLMLDIEFWRRKSSGCNLYGRLDMMKKMCNS